MCVRDVVRVRVRMRAGILSRSVHHSNSVCPHTHSDTKNPSTGAGEGRRARAEGAGGGRGRRARGRDYTSPAARWGFWWCRPLEIALRRRLSSCVAGVVGMGGLDGRPTPLSMASSTRLHACTTSCRPSSQVAP